MCQTSPSWPWGPSCSPVTWRAALRAAMMRKALTRGPSSNGTARNRSPINPIKLYQNKSNDIKSNQIDGEFFRGSFVLSLSYQIKNIFTWQTLDAIHLSYYYLRSFLLFKLQILIFQGKDESQPIAIKVFGFSSYIVPIQ